MTGIGSFTVAPMPCFLRACFSGSQIIMRLRRPTLCRPGTTARRSSQSLTVCGPQDAIKIEQANGPGSFDIPNWDTASQKKVRDALLVLAGTIPDTKRMFG